MPGKQWDRDEYLVTLDLYLNQDDYLEDSSDETVQKIAALIGRSPGAVAMRLGNYRALDPSGTKGLTNYNEACYEIWKEFYGNENELAWEAKRARERLEGGHDEPDRTGGDVNDGSQGEIETGEKISTTTSRIGQSDFRATTRDRYGDECVLCNISEVGLLQAGHILDWSDDEVYRGNPANGLLLCYNHHRAFDLNLFTLTGDGELVVNPDFEPDDEFMKRTLLDREGEKISLPQEPSSAEFLEKHNKRIPWWPPEERPNA
ncbi:HNH endonuclease [Haloarcula amylolytica]|uniref:HNH nuclease domain-containing protein n=1 Tax=Haloarcula amylolytica JCM 13557 TaxID=1227452 RepID=M0KYU5_9EURY|nr:HNH endonuclease [Haloarcula amylolytica]EMA25389.1 hypothetical protein C442_02986 [Haloarcula amylolytica JCM 13557]